MIAWKMLRRGEEQRNGISGFQMHGAGKGEYWAIEGGFRDRDRLNPRKPKKITGKGGGHSLGILIRAAGDGQQIEGGISPILIFPPVPGKDVQVIPQASRCGGWTGKQIRRSQNWKNVSGRISRTAEQKNHLLGEKQNAREGNREKGNEFRAEQAQSPPAQWHPTDHAAGARAAEPVARPAAIRPGRSP